MTDLKKFEQTSKTRIVNTMKTGRGLWQLGIDELGRTVSGSKKPAKPSKHLAKNQISPELDRYETRKIEKHKIKN